MKKIVLILLLVSSFALATDIETQQIKKEIAQAKADMQELKAKIVSLKAKLPQKHELKTHAELGYIKTDGNTDTTAMNFELKLEKEWRKHSFSYLFDGQYADDKGKEIKNKFLTEAEYGYRFDDRFSMIYLVGYKQDKFTGYNYQFYTGPGLRDTIIKTDTQKLTIEGNILYSNDSKEDIYYNLAGDAMKKPYLSMPSTISKGQKRGYAAYRAAIDYEWQVLSNLKFNQRLTYRAELANSYINFIFSKTALSSKISDIFSAGMSYDVDYVNSPLKGKKYYDRTFSLNLIMDY